VQRGWTDGDSSRGAQPAFLAAAASVKDRALDARSKLRELPLEHKTLILLMAGGIAGAH
jgi:hypothetical protein